jgi:hypothetical protein
MRRLAWVWQEVGVGAVLLLVAIRREWHAMFYKYLAPEID